MTNMAGGPGGADERQPALPVCLLLTGDAPLRATLRRAGPPPRRPARRGLRPAAGALAPAALLPHAELHRCTPAPPRDAVPPSPPPARHGAPLHADPRVAVR